MRRFLKELILSILINTLILRGLNYYHFGLIIDIHSGGLQTYLLLGTIFRIVNCILKSILHFVAIPLKMLTFGVVSILINIGVLYFFQRLINTNYADLATITLASEHLKIFILSIVITVIYTILSKLLK